MFPEYFGANYLHYFPVAFSIHVNQQLHTRFCLWFCNNNNNKSKMHAQKSSWSPPFQIKLSAWNLHIHILYKTRGVLCNNENYKGEIKKRNRRLHRQISQPATCQLVNFFFFYLYTWITFNMGFNGWLHLLRSVIQLLIYLSVIKMYSMLMNTVWILMTPIDSYNNNTVKKAKQQHITLRGTQSHHR